MTQQLKEAPPTAPEGSDGDELQVMERARAVERTAAEQKVTAAAQEAKNAELQGREAAIRKAQTEQAAQAIAAELAVDATPLLKYTDGTPEAMRELAKSLAKKVAPAAAPSFVPDSGRAAGALVGDAVIEQAYIDNPNPETRKAYEGVRARKGW